MSYTIYQTPMHTYEIEIKSLLGSKENADALKTKLKAKDPNLQLVGKNSQLNHYFNVPADLKPLSEAILPVVESDKRPALNKIIDEGKKISVRTRKADGKALFIIKASIDDTTSSNGISRIEFESPVKMSLEELDGLLLKAGLTYQAKWSRDREEYKSKNMNICIDRNAGYGYLAEFERVVDDASKVEEIKRELLDFMKDIGAEELRQDRLERMFAFYNANWPEYYGTDKVFTVE